MSCAKERPRVFQKAVEYECDERTTSLIFWRKWQSSPKFNRSLPCMTGKRRRFILRANSAFSVTVKFSGRFRLIHVLPQAQYRIIQQYRLVRKIYPFSAKGPTARCKAVCNRWPLSDFDGDRFLGRALSWTWRSWAGLFRLDRRKWGNRLCWGSTEVLCCRGTAAGSPCPCAWPA